MGTIAFTLAIIVLLLILQLVILHRKLVPYLIKSQTEKQPEFKNFQQNAESLCQSGNLVSTHQKAFCSYSRKDTEYADVIGTFARGFGKEFVRDVTHLRGGQEWKPEVEKLIKESDDFILCLSKNAKKSKYVREELVFALNLQKKEFIKPFRWKKVSIPEEIKHINITYIPIIARKQKDGTEKFEISYSPRFEFIRELQFPIIIALLLFLLAFNIFAFLGIREIQKILFAEEINYEELDKQVPPIKVKELEPPILPNIEPPILPNNVSPDDEAKQLSPEKLKEVMPESSKTPNPTSVLNAKSALPKLTNPNPKSLSTSCLNSDSSPKDSNPVSITSFKVFSESDRKNGVPDDQDKIFEAGEQLYLTWMIVNDAKSIQIKPFIADLCPYDRPLGITPDKTTTYVLEAVGFDGRVEKKEITVKVKEKISQASNLQPQIKFEVRDLTENEIIDDVDSQDLGRICYKISNAKKANISPSIGEIAVDKSEKCIEMPMGKTGNVTFTLNVTTLDNNTITKEQSFEYYDKKKSNPKIYGNSIKKKGNSDFICYKVRNIRYLAIEIEYSPSAPNYYSTFKTIGAKVRPTDNQEYCTTYDSLSVKNIKFLYFGLNDLGWASKDLDEIKSPK